MQGAIFVYQEQFRKIAQEVHEAQLTLANISGGSTKLPQVNYSCDEGKILRNELQLNDLYDSQADVMQQEERLRYLKDAYDAKERSASHSMRAFVNGR